MLWVCRLWNKLVSVIQKYYASTECKGGGDNGGVQGERPGAEHYVLRPWWCGKVCDWSGNCRVPACWCLWWKYVVQLNLCARREIADVTAVQFDFSHFYGGWLVQEK